MKYAKPLLTFLLAVAPAGLSLHAATPVWDTGAGGGIQAGSGTWDFNNIANWTLDGGTSRVGWTNNSDTASFQLQGNAGTVTIDNTNGQVGAAGLLFAGNTGGGTWTLGADTSIGIQLGAGGLTNQITTGALLVNAPLVLTASQTWASTNITQNQGQAGVRVYGAISTLSGVTNLTFDGRGLSSAYATANSASRVVIELGGNNTFHGSTSITGGAALRLGYTANDGQKLDSSSDLIFKGGSLVLNGQAAARETVASTIFDSGANTIYAGPNGGGGTTNSISLGALTHNISATLDITSAVSDLVSTTTTNVNGIIGGWATLGGNRFAAVKSGTTTIGNTGGSTQNTYTSWGATTNTAINAAVNGSTNQTTNTLRVENGGSLNLTSGTATLTAGGLLINGNSTFTGGSITSGTNALYVHTNGGSLTSSTAIVDGAGSVALVKTGSNTLTLTGANTYTGATYVNAGTLTVGAGGSLDNGNVTIRGAASFSLTSTSSIKFNLNGTDVGQFDVLTQDVGALFTLNGTMDLNFGSAFAGGSWDLFDLSNGTADGFVAITLSGAYSGSLTESAGIWTGNAGGKSFSFDESTGVLTVVPEPSTVALLLGAAGTLAMARRRRVR